MLSSQKGKVGLFQDDFPCGVALSHYTVDVSF